MKKFLCGMASMAALSAFTLSAHATTFLYSGALDAYLVPTSGLYDFTVAGAQGGESFEYHNFGADPGNGGTLISGDIYLGAGTLLSVLVGGGGGCGCNGDGGSGGSGGGMSFLAIGGAPLVVAGGGGGGSWNGLYRGGPGQTGTSGQSFAGVIGGADGQGGPAALSGSGGSGAGWFSAGGPALATYYTGSGGQSGPTFAGGAGYVPDPCCYGMPFNSGSGTGAIGGFGGGGGGGYGSGGGGGGYSGGAAGGGGGGSFTDPSVTLIAAVAGGNSGTSQHGANGYVTLNFLSAAVPEPATWAMMLIGFGAVGFVIRHCKYERKLA